MSNKTVTSIELIYYENPNARINPSEIFLFDINRLSVLDVLENDKINYFLDEFDIGVIAGTIKTTLFSHEGIGFRFIHDDGSFKIITLSIIDEEKFFFMGHYDEMGVAIQTRSEVGISGLVERFNYLLGFFVLEDEVADS